MPETSTTSRSFWSGTLSFGLVSVPVDLFAANRARRFSLRMLGPEGQPLKRQYVCAREGKALDRDELVRGYEVEEGQFVTITDEELEALEPDKTRDIDLNRFVPRDAVSPAYFERSYYLVPSGNSTKAYRLLAATMEKTGRAGIATFVMRSKAYVIAIFSEGGVLAAQTLRFADELRSAEDMGLGPAKTANAKRVAHMKKLIEQSKVESFDPKALEGFADEQAAHLRTLAEKKLEKGEDVVEAEGQADADAGEVDSLDELDGGDGKVIDLMQVLRRRLGEEAGASPRPAKGKSSGKEAHKGVGHGRKGKVSSRSKGDDKVAVRAPSARAHGTAARKANRTAPARKAPKPARTAAKGQTSRRATRGGTHARKKQS